MFESEISSNITAYTICRKFPDAKYILDLGMGKGGYLVKKLQEEGKITFGVDLRNFHQSGLIIANAKKLPFADETFDLVHECFFLADLVGLQDATEEVLDIFIKEAKRVLKIGGVFYSLPHPEYASDFFDKRIFTGANDNPYIGIYVK